MLTMNTDRGIVLLALCFMCVSANDMQYSENSCEASDYCETHTLSVSLGSSVLLPCNFPTSSLGWVSWVHVPEQGLIHLTSEGRVNFTDPRHGRVKAFPNQGSQGNYSICIDELESSDLGCYLCQQGQDCLQVELDAEIKDTQSNEWLLLVYICAGVAALILLTAGGFCCVKYIQCCDCRTQDSMNVSVVAAGAGAQETGRVPEEQQGGADNLVYENDDQDPANKQGDPTRYPCSRPGVLDRTQPTPSTSGIYPDLNQFNSERVESQRRKNRFHTDLFSRLRQVSSRRHYYVNQGELRKQQEMTTRGGLGKNKDKENCQYKNPIYNRSTEQLNHLQGSKERV